MGTFWERNAVRIYKYSKYIEKERYLKYNVNILIDLGMCFVKKITIKDIYPGKPDAKDEITFNSSDDFVKTFVIADHFNIDSLINGSNCFITGFKGTGKTALLYYLDNYIKQLDAASCSSFILFKEDFPNLQRTKMQNASNRILSSVSVERNALKNVNEFEYIWRWLFFKRIVSDNTDYNNNLFKNDENWHKFENLINRIKDPINSRKSIIFDKIKIAFPIKDIASATETGTEIEVDLSKNTTENYKKFVLLIDEAEVLFASLEKTDIPYYVFVDELEAYYGDDNIFKRDLGLIRDLIFTVKRFNEIISRSNYKQMKIICSVRSEIINAISRFITTREINKVVNGFSLPLNWSYSNNSSYSHPIIKILLKRIAVCSECDDKSDLEIFNEWFPESINGIDPVSYILNNSWYKPRDMVRLITTAQNCIHNKSSCFSQAVLNSSAKAYSEDSLSEIKEELQALYDSQDIDVIMSCFTGFKTIFSFSQFEERVKKYFSGTILETDTIPILNDLYRLGFLGNYLPVGKVFHWQHKGDGLLILSDEWRICIHFALRNALSLSSKNNLALNANQTPEIGDVSTALVYNSNNSFAYVNFEMYGKRHKGAIHKKEFKKLGFNDTMNFRYFVESISEFECCIKSYNEERKLWQLEIVKPTNIVQSK